MKTRNLIFSIIMLFSISIFANDVSIKKAKQVAKNFFYEHINQITKTNYNDLVFDNYYTEMSGNTSMFYIFNRKDIDGFIIVSGDDALPPVLGYSFKRNFEIDNLAPVVKDILDNYKIQQEIVKKNNLPSPNAVAEMWNKLDYSKTTKSITEIQTVDALTLVEWNQGSYYNADCPVDNAGPSGRVYVGCVATAMAQAMKYFNYPLHGESSSSYDHSTYGELSANYGASTYNWGNMPNTLHEANDEVAQVSYHCGVAVEMNYGPDGSGSSTGYIVYGLEDFFRYSTDASIKYKSSYTESNWAALLKSQLDQSLPMVYTGSGTTSGHAWNCDGYQDDNFFRMNWGWGGSNNGFFQLDDMYAPANPGEEPHSLMNYQKAIINIYPDENYPEHCTSTNFITGNAGSFKDGSSYEQYKNNQDCSYIIDAECGNYITLNFETFDVDPSDVIYVYDGGTTNDEIIATFYGGETPTEVSGTNGKLLIKFVTDGSGVAAGWSASYSVEYCISDALVTAPSGVIGDGSGSCDYKKSTYCSWIIQPVGAESITFDFTQFEVGDAIDYLAIYENSTSGNRVAKLKASNLPTAPITVNSGTAALKFFSTSSNQAEGWTANYTSNLTKVDMIEQNKLNVIVYPNPFIGDTKISYNINKNSNVTISLTNIIGETLNLISKQQTQGDYSIKLSEINSNIKRGIYFVNIKTNNNSVTKKVICL